jgi:hypothetical protein
LQDAGGLSREDAKLLGIEVVMNEQPGGIAPLAGFELAMALF